MPPPPAPHHTSPKIYTPMGFYNFCGDPVVPGGLVPPHLHPLDQHAGAGRAEHEEVGQWIVTVLPYIKQEIPIMIVFRALGFVANR